MVYVVKDELGTRYIINAIDAKFRGLLYRAEINNATVDLCDCKLGPTCAETLKRYYKTVNFINSTDSVLNSILQNNMKIKRTDVISFTELNIPFSPNMENFIDIVKNLKSGDEYEIHPSVDNYRQLSIATLLILTRPDVIWDIEISRISIYDFVVNEWKLRQREHREYIEIMDSGGFKKLEVTSDGLLGTSANGYMRAELYINRYRVLPYDFGTKMCYELDDKGKPTGEWGEVINKCLKYLITLEIKRNKIEDYLKFQGE